MKFVSLSITLLAAGFIAHVYPAIGQVYSLTPYSTLQLPSHDEVSSLAFSSDSKYLIAGSTKGSVLVWLLETGAVIYRGGGYKDILFVDFLTGTQEIVVVNKKGKIMVINLLSRQQVFSFSARSKPIAIALDAGKRYLALINTKQQIEIFDLLSKMPLGTVDGSSDLKHAVFLGFDRLGKHLVAITKRGKVFTWNPVTLKLLQQMSLGGREWHGSQSTIHAASTNRSANVFIVGLEEVTIPKGGLKGTARPGDLMRTNTIIAYDFNTGMEVKRVKYPYQHVILIAMGPGNDHAVISSYESEDVHLLDFRKGEIVAARSLQSEPTAISIAEDDRYLSAGFSDGKIGLWSVSLPESTSLYSVDDASMPTLGARIRPTKKLPPALQPGNPVTLAILEFRSRGIRQDIGPTCLDLMHTGMANIGYITLVERDRIEEVIKELSLSMTGLTEADGIAIGKILNADYVLFCSVGALGSSYVFNARMVNVETGKIEAGRGVIAEECRDQDVFDAVNMLVETLAE